MMTWVPAHLEETWEVSMISMLKSRESSSKYILSKIRYYPGPQRSAYSITHMHIHLQLILLYFILGLYHLL